jgi:hypothetical protein
MILAMLQATVGIDSRAKLTIGVNSLPDGAVHPWRA